jgi:hypothetical protein
MVKSILIGSFSALCLSGTVIGQSQAPTVQRPEPPTSPTRPSVERPVVDRPMVDRHATAPLTPPTAPVAGAEPAEAVKGDGVSEPDRDVEPATDEPDRQGVRGRIR